MKVYLLGYMGSGKSSAGKMLAEKMKLTFIDFDRYMEEKEGKTIAEIFDTKGEDKFRELEHHHLKTLLSAQNVVISLGGGTPCFHNNMELILANGTSVYLEMDVETLVKRLAHARNKRPLIRSLNDLELRYFIEANLDKRKSIYEQAHFTINGNGLNESELVEKISEKLKT